LSRPIVLALALLGASVYFADRAWKRILELDPGNYDTAAQVALAIIGAAVALGTFGLTFQQKQTQAKRDALNEDFHHLLEMFVRSDNPMARSAAAVQLAERAQCPNPGSPRRKSSANYPDYQRAASHLARGINFELDGRVQDSLDQAIKQLASFDCELRQELHPLLVSSLANANRLAFDAFIDALGEYWVARGGHLHSSPFGCRSLLAEVFDLCSRSHVLSDRAVLLRVLGTKGRSAIARHQLQREAGGKEPMDRGSDEFYYFLNRLHNAAKQLDLAQSALVGALRNLESVSLPNRRVDEERPVRSPHLDLSRCYLSGWHCRSSQLQGIDLTEAVMIDKLCDGADMRHCTMSEAEFRHSNFHYADLRFCKAFELSASRACFQEADLRHARLIGCDLRFADFAKADLGDCDLSESNLRGADLRGANLRGTRLAGINPGYDHESGIALFTPGAWRSADFRIFEWDDGEECDYPTAEKDTALITWLNVRYP
jgi:uncharacterized protein YjbI with pentapeptide repeats